MVEYSVEHAISSIVLNWSTGFCEVKSDGPILNHGIFRNILQV
jgi:hypothetical protein